jgi:pSer/pThr/pTyr-binding forkhead associated (FHA) protein
MKKVQLVVVQGKNEGKTITLPGAVFRIGRGETCHLRPNSERVSREHAEISISDDRVVVRDLGSRNGTLVNGKALTEPCVLKDRDLVQVGPLSFTVAIHDASGARAAAAEEPPGTEAEETDSWQISEIVGQAPGEPAATGGDTVLIPAFTNVAVPSASDSSVSATDASDEEYERYPDAEGAEPGRKAPRGTEAPKPKSAAAKAGPKSGDAASEILRKIMSRRQTSK